tara:strand:+ start:552 stop:1316 length:765 start_codon:yes stop_codon:yes gene_type:complete
MSKIKGLSNSDLLNLERSIGNQRSGFKPKLKPNEVNSLINKAVSAGADLHDIAKFLHEKDCVKTEASGYTMVRRTQSIFKNLDSSIHKRVAYTGSTSKNIERDSNSIGFQVAYELSRFDKQLQNKVLDFIIKYKIPWGNVKDIKQLVEIGNKTIEEIFEDIRTKRGDSEYLTVSSNIVLSELSEKIYSIKNQEERNKIFIKILKKSNIEKKQLSDFHLGSRSFFIKFNSKRKKLSEEKLGLLVGEIIENINNHK